MAMNDRHGRTPRTTAELERLQEVFLALFSPALDAPGGFNTVIDTARVNASYPETIGVHERDEVLPGRHGPVPIRIYTPYGAPRGTLLWAHGGGFVGGHLAMPEAHWVALMVAAHGFSVVTTSYRKALGGITYPVPSDDVLAAWAWLVHRSSEDPALPRPLHLGGASAGAALTAGITVRVRDAGDELPASLFLAYPIVHPEVPARTPEQDAVLLSIPYPISDPDLVLGLNYNFAGSAAALQDTHAFAGLADLHGFPPTSVLVSEYDGLRPSGERFVRQLQDAGVRSQLAVEAGAAHGQLNEPDDPVGRASLDRLRHWLDSESPNRIRS